MSSQSSSGKTLEFLFDFGSPTTYLAYTQLPSVIEATGATLILTPVLLGGIFKATGNSSPATVPAKGKWMHSDMTMCAEHYGVPFALNPNFPINTLSLMRGAVAVQMHQPELLDLYMAAVFNATWAEQKNMGDLSIVSETLADAGLEPNAIFALSNDPNVKAKLISNTENAVARGVFGAPSFFVGDRLYFGQDRLAFIQHALS
jgi:2-hydroxychromene-2-carboxylate isomerase